jgi:hypothetical protein
LLIVSPSEAYKQDVKSTEVSVTVFLVAFFSSLQYVEMPEVDRRSKEILVQSFATIIDT